MRFFRLTTFIFLSLLLNDLLAQPVWNGGYPRLRVEANGFGIVTNLNVQSTVYYVVYDIDPGAGPTAAQVRSGTGPSAGNIVRTGNFPYGNSSYTSTAPPVFTPGVPGAERTVSETGLNASFTYTVFVVAETLPGAVLQATPVKLSVTTRAETCFRVGSTSIPPGQQQLVVASSRCSPATMTWQVTYIGVDYALPANVTLRFLWADNLAGENEILTATIVDASERNKDFQQWRVTRNHVYNYDLGADPNRIGTTGSGCTFNPQVILRFPPNVFCGAANQQTNFTVWDTEDNLNLGDFDINPDGPDPSDEPFEVCEGDRASVSLVDASVFNCTAAEPRVDPGVKNLEQRWVQWVYGVNVGAANFPTTGAGATERITINGVDYDPSDFPLYGPIEYGPPPQTNGFSAALNIQMPTTATVGQEFHVELRSWNFCNPYDADVTDGNGLNPVGGTFNPGPGPGNWIGAPFPNANFAPVNLIKVIEIIDSPNPPVSQAGMFVRGSPMHLPFQRLLVQGSFTDGGLMLP
ncbi:hypothetical protein QQ054_00285 [Oscillatoria amoena NRMC-F 0135]|nr:hypothetical protein [Oscillatoria amoena NRMC-F 0135]